MLLLNDNLNFTLNWEKQYLIILLLVFNDTCLAFSYSVWCSSWICQIQALMCWDMFLLWFISIKISLGMNFRFGQLFCIYWDDHVTFVLDIFHVLILVCMYFDEKKSPNLPRKPLYILHIVFFVVWFYLGFGIWVILNSWNEYGNATFLYSLWEILRNIGIHPLQMWQYSVNLSDFVFSSAFVCWEIVTTASVL